MQLSLNHSAVLWLYCPNVILDDIHHTGLWLRTGCVTNAQVSFFGRTGF